MRALVIGAAGAVGRATVGHLRSQGSEAVAAGRRPGGDLILDVTTASGRRILADVAQDVDVVIDASGQEDVRLLAAIDDTPLVDVSASPLYLEELRRTARGGQSVVLGAGLVPGLSTVMVSALDLAPGADVDVMVVLGAGETHGAAAVRWISQLLGRDLYLPHEGRRITNLHSGRRYRGPDGRWRLYLRADFPDHVLVGVNRGIAVRSYLAMSPRLATVGLAVAARLPHGDALVRRAPHLGTSEEWHLDVVDRDSGRALAARGRNQSNATGVLTAAVAARVAETPPRRAVTTAEVLSWEEAWRVLEHTARS